MYTFKKEERLCNKRLIDGLFHNGSSFLCYPFKVSWSVADAAMPQHVPAQILFSVAKKRFKRAVDRNVLKRRMREAYRLSKQQLLYDALQTADKKIILSVGYIGKGIEPYDMMQKRMQKLLGQLSNEIIK